MAREVIYFIGTLTDDDTGSIALFDQQFDKCFGDLCQSSRENSSGVDSRKNLGETEQELSSNDNSETVAQYPVRRVVLRHEFK